MKKTDVNIPRNKIKKNNKRETHNVDTETYKEVLKEALGIIKDADFNPDITSIENITLYNKKLYKTIDDLLVMFPDVNLAIEIITSLIENPNTMQETYFNYRFRDFSLPKNISNAILDIVREYTELHYKEREKISDIIKETMFTRGSYVELIIPPETFKEFIKMYKKLTNKKPKSKFEISLGLNKKNSPVNKNKNITTESVKSCNSGFSNTIEETLLLYSIENDILSPNKDNSYISKEDVKEVGPLFNITSNPLSLSIMELRKRVVDLESKVKFSGLLDLGLEGVKEINEELLFMFMDNDNSLEAPIVKKIDTDKVVPVRDENDPSTHYGYFIFLDNKGNVLKSKSKDNPFAYTQNINVFLTKKEKEKDRKEKIFRKVTETLGLVVGDAPEINNLKDLKNYLLKNMIDKYLKSTLFENVDGVLLEMDNNLVELIAEYLYNNIPVNAVFVPKELVSYYAIDYRRNGTGKSILEKLIILLSLKAIIFYTELIGAIKASMSTTVVDIEINDDDIKDYDNIINEVKKRIYKNAKYKLPVGVIKINDILDILNELGYSFRVKGKYTPGVEINFSEERSDFQPIPDELKEKIDKAIITSMLLTPEIVDNSMSPDFATTIIANANLLAKRISKQQKKFSEKLTESVVKKLRVDGRFKSRVINLLKRNVKSTRNYVKRRVSEIEKIGIERMSDDLFIEWLFNKILLHLDVYLPQPEVTEDNNLENLYDKYNNLIENIFNDVLTTDFLPSELVGQLGDKAGTIINVIKSMLKLRFVLDKKLIPQLNDMLTVGDDGVPMYNPLEDYDNLVKIFGDLMVPFLRNTTDMKSKLDKRIEKAVDEHKEDDTDDNNVNESINEDETENDKNNNKDTEMSTNEEENNEETKNNTDAGNDDLDKEFEDLSKF